MERLARPVRVLLADDESMFRLCLRHLLTAPPALIKHVYNVEVGLGFTVVGESGTGEETLHMVQAVRPDLLIVDLSMPRMTGLQALRELDTSGNSMRAILLAGTLER